MPSLSPYPVYLAHFERGQLRMSFFSPVRKRGGVIQPPDPELGRKLIEAIIKPSSWRWPRKVVRAEARLRKERGKFIDGWVGFKGQYTRDPFFSGEEAPKPKRVRPGKEADLRRALADIIHALDQRAIVDAAHPAVCAARKLLAK